VREVKKPDI